MAKKTVEVPKSDASALTHNPFSKLAVNVETAAKLGNAQPPAAVIRNRPKQAPPPRRITMRLESKGRAGKVITRISGLPLELLDTVAVRLRKALGCGAIVEGEDLILLGSLKERAAEWLERVGDVRKLAPEPPAAAPISTSVASASEAASRSVAQAAPLASGTKRSQVRRGLRVAIVMKADQSTGALTEGIVSELLTSSPEHPRGIKVRLESGEVGRVKFIRQ